MISIIVAVIPILLKIVEMIINKYSKNAEIKKMIADLIRACKEDGLISVKNSDSQKLHHNDVLKQINEAKTKDVT